jgi:DNA processing protein
MAEPVVTLAIHSLETLHTTEKLSLLDTVTTESDFLRLSRRKVEEIIGRRLKIREFRPEGLLQAASKDLKYLTQAQIAYTFYWSGDYPPLLREIYDPPFVLFYRGHLPDSSRPLLAIVGTRRPTGVGLRAAFQLGSELGSENISVVSGLARGVDAAAHRGNIHGGGKTVAVLGSGIDRIYPDSNRRLAESILTSGGMICSEFAPGVPPLRHHFPGRNRIISGLSRGVVIVEAPVRSGALITADFCLEQGRDLYVHQSGLAGPNREGCAELAGNGAVIVSSPTEILRDWSVETPPNGPVRAGERPILRRKQREARSTAPGQLEFELEDIRPELVETDLVDNSVRTGTALADLMRRELAGTVTTYYGAYFRRSDRWQKRRFTRC